MVVLVLATIVFCCCRSRWRNRASAIEAATLAKSQPKVEPMTPTGPAPFAVNYPQFQVRMLLMAPLLASSSPPPHGPSLYPYHPLVMPQHSIELMILTESVPCVVNYSQFQGRTPLLPPATSLPLPRPLSYLLTPQPMWLSSVLSTSLQLHL